MIEQIDFSRNRSDYEQVLAHLNECEADFVPPLNQRLAISVYAQKLIDRAVRFEAWYDTDLVGLTALYCNDSSRSSAFITNVSVTPPWQGRGIAGLLLERSVDAMGELSFETIELEVGQQNSAAIGLYKKYGFSLNHTNDQSLVMTLVIGN